jgi:ATP-binding cassette subfamily F protein 3
VGVNGAGKSTLIKLLVGAEPATTGELRLGHNVEPDYFAQDQYKALDPSARLIDDLTSVAPMAVSGQTQLRSLLGCFLFTGDEAFKQISVLSGGERNRYALLRMLLQPRNFLLLDEPTNHLDLRAKDVLLNALEEYSGTVVFVSHDRYFIDKLATRIFEVENGQFHEYSGNYEDYLRQKNRADLPPAATADPLPEAMTEEALTGTRNGQPKVNESTVPRKKLNPILVRQMISRRTQLEQDIARCETEITANELELANFKSAEESIRLIKRMDENRTLLAGMMKEWETLSRNLDESGDAVERDTS